MTRGGPAREGSSEATSVALYSVLVIAWGLNYVVLRWGLEVAGPLWLAFLRAGVGALGVLVFLVATGRTGALDRAGRLDAMLLGVPTTGLFFGLWFVAALSVPPGQSAVLIYTFPLWVAILSAALFRHRLGAGPILSIALGFAGVILVSQPWRTGGAALPPLAVAELLGGALAWAIGTVIFQRRFEGVEVAEANLYQLAGGTAVLLVASLLLDPSPPEVSSRLLLVTLWLGLVGTSVAYAIWYALLDRYSAVSLSAYTFLIPLAALAASFLLLGE
ncbi:MAG: DMT family transporter, partial [Thermoplasmata archaeon]